MPQEKRVKARSFVTLMLLTLGSRILGLVRVVTQGYFIGGKALGDAFTAAFTIPNLFRRLFAEASMAAAFVPTFKGYLKKDKKQETQEFINSIFTLLTLFVTVTVILGMVSMPLIVKVINKQSADIPELILLTRIMFPYLAFISIAAIFQSLLNSLNIFGPGGFAPILFNIVVISATYILSKYTANPGRAMAIGVTCGGFLQMAFQIPYLIKTGYKVSFRGLKKAFTHPGTRKVARLLAPTLIGTGAYPLSNAIATTIALNTGESVNSSLQFSLRLQELVLGIFAVSIGTILLSTLSKNVKDRNWESYSKSLGLSLNAISIITIPITIFAIINARELVELVYFGGKFDMDLLLMTTDIFKIHIGALFFIAVTRILGPAFYSMEDTKTPAILGIVSLAIGIVLMFILAPLFHGNGIALAVSISSLCLMILYFIFMGKKKEIGFSSITRKIVPSLIKVLFFSAISAIPLILLKDEIYTPFISDNKLFRLIPPLVISTLLFFIIYVLLLFISKDRNLKELLKEGKKKS